MSQASEVAFSSGDQCCPLLHEEGCVGSALFLRTANFGSLPGRFVTVFIVIAPAIFPPIGTIIYRQSEQAEKMATDLTNDNAVLDSPRSPSPGLYADSVDSDSSSSSSNSAQTAAEAVREDGDDFISIIAVIKIIVLLLSRVIVLLEKVLANDFNINKGNIGDGSTATAAQVSGNSGQSSPITNTATNNNNNVNPKDSATSNNNGDNNADENKDKGKNKEETNEKGALFQGNPVGPCYLDTYYTYYSCNGSSCSGSDEEAALNLSHGGGCSASSAANTAEEAKKSTVSQATTTTTTEPKVPSFSTHTIDYILGKSNSSSSGPQKPPMPPVPSPSSGAQTGVNWSQQEDLQNDPPCSPDCPFFIPLTTLTTLPLTTCYQILDAPAPPKWGRSTWSSTQATTLLPFTAVPESDDDGDDDRTVGDAAGGHAEKWTNATNNSNYSHKQELAEWFAKNLEDPTKKKMFIENDLAGRLQSFSSPTFGKRSDTSSSVEIIDEDSYASSSNDEETGKEAEGNSEGQKEVKEVGGAASAALTFASALALYNSRISTVQQQQQQQSSTKTAGRSSLLEDLLQEKGSADKENVADSKAMAVLEAFSNAKKAQAVAMEAAKEAEMAAKVAMAKLTDFIGKKKE
ncbi:hypothetical protein TYRP_006346 [Tyrophagus putrescentiae]|nr:hypothetical protein TYRP_006346 [Tyrophagus putrescentiae]